MNSPEIATLGLSGGEIVMFLVVLGIFSSTRFMLGMARGIREFLDQAGHDAGKSLGANYGRPAAEALTVDNQTAEVHDLSVLRDSRPGLDRDTEQRRMGVIRALGWILAVMAGTAIAASVIAILRGK